ncbi:MAG: hypothetical protein J6127_05675, partial [Clostridiales bacterium]|nr:hypothetical protein [Clostridiales bacterium]
LADEFEAIPAGEKTLREKKMVELLKAFGDDRYTDLVDELTFIEPDMIDDVEEDEVDEPITAPVVEQIPVTEDDAEEIHEEEPVEQAVPEQVVPEVESEEEKAAREERERREEAKAILTQQILPRAVPPKPLTEEEKRQAVTVHPNEVKPEKTAPRKKRKGSLFLDLTSHTEDNSETEIKSAVRQVLDETEGK